MDVNVCSNLILIPSAARRRLHCSIGFSLLELILVMALCGAIMMLAVPSLTAIKEGSDITNAAYQISDMIQNSRSYSIANNTYTWVGFYEEDATEKSPTNITPPYRGVGRVVMAIVASKAGTALFKSTDTPVTLPTAKLVQIQKLIKIKNLHLADIGVPVGGDTDTLDGRPSLPYTAPLYSRISSENNDTTAFPFTVQGYTFYKTICFNPRGETNLNSTNDLRSLIEIGLKPTHGTVVDSNSKNVVAIQVTGISGNTRIYRR